MPLPIPEVERTLTHTRRVRYEGYKRTDGYWDIEALPRARHGFGNGIRSGIDEGAKKRRAEGRGERRETRDGRRKAGK
jgi:hypothetical protein